jgi:hypothetical protein
MTDHDDVLNELDAALQVEPSRAFADGVRARVNRSRTYTTRVWWGLAAAASIGLATMTLWRPGTLAPANGEPVQVAAAPTQAPVPAIPSKVPEPVVAMPPVAPATVTRSEATVPHATVTRATLGTTASEPRLEVITNQGAVLRQLWADYQGRPLVIAEAGQVVDELMAKPIEVAPVVVRPIVVREIGKEPGPAGAAPIIRRADATGETR